jgi:adenine-specific DNA methylase
MRANKTNGDCERCAALRRRFNIRSPADLSQAIRVARVNIADGTIEEVPSLSRVLHEPFSAISADGPWEDVVGYGFRCTSCGQLFYLSAETYHGSGGEWRPVTRI